MARRSGLSEQMIGYVERGLGQPSLERSLFSQRCDRIGGVKKKCEMRKNENRKTEDPPSPPGFGATCPSSQGMGAASEADQNEDENGMEKFE
jgi:hypothetical protein